MNSRLTIHYLLQVAVGFYMLSPSLRVTFAIDAPAGEHQGSYLSYVDTDFTTALREVQYVKPELQEHEHVDLWLIAGQSNAAGDNGYCNETMPPELEPLPPQVAFAWRFSDRQWFKGTQVAYFQGAALKVCTSPHRLQRCPRLGSRINNRMHHACVSFSIRGHGPTVGKPCQAC